MYLARHGRPLVPSDLTRHRCLILNGVPDPTTWVFHADGARVAVEMSGAVSADSSDVLLRLAMEGVGIVRLGELAVARALENRWLEPLLLDAQVSEGYPLWAVLPPGRQRSPKSRRSWNSSPIDWVQRRGAQCDERNRHEYDRLNGYSLTYFCTRQFRVPATKISSRGLIAM